MTNLAVRSVMEGKTPPFVQPGLELFDNPAEEPEILRRA